MKISDYTAQNPVCTLSELMLCGTDQFGRSFAPVPALNKKAWVCSISFGWAAKSA